MTEKRKYKFEFTEKLKNNAQNIYRLKAGTKTKINFRKGAKKVVKNSKNVAKFAVFSIL